ncbi:MAG TPA: hypothetical protein VKR53_00340 [Puia sp.]|nr:hypothetical protein [Puia sp.]
MKKLLVISVLSLAMVFSASAQHLIRGGGGGFYGGPRVFVGGGWGIYAPLYYNPYWAYPPYGYYGYYRPMSKLDMQISDIKYDYSEKMALTRQDKSLTHKQRRQKIRELKHERDNAINDAKQNYYKH